MKKISIYLDEKKIFILILVLAIFSSFFMLGKVPGGINQDEAYAGYEAYSMLHYGTDSHGYTNPVYLVTWGSGMSVLYSYLSIPFIALLGLNSLSVRLVEAIFSIVLVIFLYKLVKRINGETCALWAMFILTIVPWRILMSRWGIDCNLAPAFLVMAWYFMVRVVDDNRFIILAFVFYGLSLYCYATLWILVPIMLALQMIYLILNHKIKLNIYFVIAAILLGLLAIPLMIFLLVQYGYIGEIKTNFISIPLLPGFRGGETGFSNIVNNFKNLIEMLYRQSDNLLWNSDGKFGIYYNISLFFIVLGGGILIWRTFSSLKKRCFDLNVFHFINLLTIFVQGIMISDINVNKINSIHVLMVILIALAIEWFTMHVDIKKIKYGIALVYICLYVCFTKYYYTDYANSIAGCFQQNLENAITWLNENIDKDVILVGNVNYAKYLFLTKYPTDKFVKSVNYTNYPNPWLSVSGFEGVTFESEIDVNNIEYSKAYVCSVENENMFTNTGVTIKKFGDWMVAYYE